MRRTPLLTTLLWTSASGIGVAACGGDPAPIVDARLVDGMADAFVGPIARFPSALAAVSECGVAMPPTVELPVQNVGTSPLTISGATASGGFAVTTAFPVEIAPGASAPIAVRPPAAVIGTDVGGASKIGTLALRTNQPGTIGTVMLTSNVHGANLAFTDGGGAPLAQIDLSSSTGACPAPVSVFVRNTGNAAATVVPSSSASEFSVGAFSPSGTVAGGGVISHDVGATTTSACIASAAIAYTVTGAVCTTVPVSLPANLNIAGSSSCSCG